MKEKNSFLKKEKLKLSNLNKFSDLSLKFRLKQIQLKDYNIKANKGKIKKRNIFTRFKHIGNNIDDDILNKFKNFSKILIDNKQKKEIQKNYNKIYSEEEKINKSETYKNYFFNKKENLDKYELSFEKIEKEIIKDDGYFKFINKLSLLFPNSSENNIKNNHVKNNNKINKNFYYKKNISFSLNNLMKSNNNNNKNIYKSKQQLSNLSLNNENNKNILSKFQKNINLNRKYLNKIKFNELENKKENNISFKNINNSFLNESSMKIKEKKNYLNLTNICEPINFEEKKMFDRQIIKQIFPFEIRKFYKKSSSSKNIEPYERKKLNLKKIYFNTNHIIEKEKFMKLKELNKKNIFLFKKNNEIKFNNLIKNTYNSMLKKEKIVNEFLIKTIDKLNDKFNILNENYITFKEF